MGHSVESPLIGVAPAPTQVKEGNKLNEVEPMSGVEAIPEGVEQESTIHSRVEELIAQCNDKASAESSLSALASVFEEDAAASPYAAKHLDALITKTGDKKTTAAATQAVFAAVKCVGPHAISIIAPILVGALGNKRKPEEKEVTLNVLTKLAEEHPKHIAWCLEQVLPSVLDQMTAIKKNVKDAAMKAANALTKTSGNADIDPFIPQMLNSVVTATTIGDTVEALAGCVFVQPVLSPALAVTTPVIVRGLKDRKEATKRRACVIVDNMSKLVPEPREIVPFLPQLIPLLAKACDEISDPEARGVAERAHLGLLRLQENSIEVKAVAPEAVVAVVQEVGGKGAAVTEVADYTAKLACALSNARNFESTVWADCFTVVGLSEECAKAAREFCFRAANASEADDYVEEEGVDLCNCVFTLGYGSLTLLNNTRLHLKRGMNYGLLGANDCGKTTLMRAINAEQVDGFPPKSELKTAFVEHGIGEAEPECDWSPLDYLLDEPVIKTMHEEGKLSKEAMIAELEKVGFRKGDKLDMTLGQLSGGWKMKMGLVRAMLMEADILMMDEPTGHLDKFNCAWLTEYVQSLRTGPKPVTVIATSHDTTFLEATTTHILEFENRKLKVFKGTLGKFVEIHPEAMKYFEIRAAKVKFTFPNPGFLEGVKSRGRALLKMSDVEFTYPGKDTPTLFGVGVQASMLSRVAILGPNGAGKSTMIKCLLGELKPTRGSIWKQPGTRVAYMSQHAFHHIEDHLDRSATQYIMQRFAGGEDNESLENLANLGTTKESEKQSYKKFVLKDGDLVECETYFDDKAELQYQKKSLEKAVKLEGIASRRKGKKQNEYQCKWAGYSIDFLTWVPRSTLVSMGNKTEVQREDEKQAAMSGLQNKQLTTPGVEAHLANFGVEPEFATHNPLKALSAGQKVKVVLGAAMWQNPHLLVIDEPTNYLDRDALGALTEAIEAWSGGVVVISHNLEFCHRVATEKWLMDAGHLSAEGGQYEDMKLDGGAEVDEIVDASGNTIKVARKKTLTDKDKKKMIKDIEKKLATHAKKDNLTDEDFWELTDKLAELKKELEKEATE